MCEIVRSKSEIDRFIAERLSSAKNEKQAVVLVGGPGSGKSVGKKAAVSSLQKTIRDFVNIDPDEILGKLFNNDNECYGKVIPINNDSYEMAIEQNKNIIFDGTGRNFEWYSNNVLKKLKDNHYQVNLVIVMNSVENVLPRIKKRAEEEGRDVDEEYTRSVYETLSVAIPKYLSLDCNYIDSIFLYDNSQDSIHFLYKMQCKDDVKRLVLAVNSVKSTSDKQKKYLIRYKMKPSIKLKPKSIKPYMSQYDFIVNPTTGKKVKLSSPLGRLILNSYSQVAGGDSFEEERGATNHEKRLEIHELLETNYREYLDDEVPEYNYTVFFENDMVKVSPITAYYPDDTPDELKANNSVGTIVDPRKLGINLTDNENIAFKYFHPEDLVDHSEFGKGNFIYTKQSGLQILEFNKILYSTGDVSEALGDNPSDEMINYAQEIGDIDIEFNKTTSHPDDVSFYSIHPGIDRNKNEKLYMVNWEKEGEQFLSLMPVSHLRFDRRQDMYYTSSDDEEDEDGDGDDEPDQSSESDSSSVASDDFSRAIGDIIPDDESIHGSETHSLAGDVSLDRSRDDEIMDHILELPNEPSQFLDQSHEEMPVNTLELDQLLDDASAIINNT